MVRPRRVGGCARLGWWRRGRSSDLSPSVLAPTPHGPRMRQCRRCGGPSSSMYSAARTCGFAPRHPPRTRHPRPRRGPANSRSGGGDLERRLRPRWGPSPVPPSALVHPAHTWSNLCLGPDFPRCRRPWHCTRPVSARPTRGSKTWRPPSSGLCRMCASWCCRGTKC